MAMTAARMRTLESNLTGIAKKVYAVVPINESWSSKQIVAEIARLGSAPDFPIIQGCLNSLKDSGLICELSRGSFQRLKPKTEEAAKPEPTKRAQIPDQKSIVDADPASMLASLTNQLRTTAKGFFKLADDIDYAVLTLEEKFSSNDEELMKLRQLKSLLKGLGA